MKHFLIGFALCILQLAAFSFCSGYEPEYANNSSSFNFRFMTGSRGAVIGLH